MGTEINRSGDGVREVSVARIGERGPCGAGGGGTNAAFCAEYGERCVAEVLSRVPCVLFPGMRGNGCVMEGTKEGCWND